MPLLLLLAALLTLAGCRARGADAPLFERRSARETGITFVNRLREDDSLHNPLAFDYVYNGAGVGVGDFDGDGRPDLYFAGNMVSGRLYLNRGHLRFDDVTAAAGLTTDVWTNGVAVADVDQDGRPDLFLCAGGAGAGAERRRNRLYLNRGPDARGVPRFEERAAQAGLADTGWSTHAAFLDYDRDGDLDLYVVRNALERYNRNTIRRRVLDGSAASTDRLYRNDGRGAFTDVSRQAGITAEGYGLGVAVSDLDQDGWPDLYVANDFLTNDLVWVNNRDGTFTNRAARYLKHQTHNAMGTDVADVDNDGRPDIVVVDMLPPGNARRKTMLPGGNYDRFHLSLGLGYEPQYMRNTLQLNNGPGPDGEPTFSDVGQLAGVHATDWSWAPLLADLDNDGRRDLFVTNGYRRDVTNLDFIVYGQEGVMMGTPASRRQRLLAALRALPEVPLTGAVFRNDGGLAFSDRTRAWGLTTPGFYNGAATADLDGDGDLDLVANALDGEALVYENHAERLGRHWVRVAFRGAPGNRDGYGAKVVVTAGGVRQYAEQSPFRGYESTVENVVHFGLGAAARVDSLQVYWPDGAYELMTAVPAGRTVVVDRRAAAPGHPFAPPAASAGRLFTAAPLAPALVDSARDVADFKVTPLLPHKHSTGGPALAAADVDGNGLDDVYLGADRGVPKRLLLQTAPGRFAPHVVDADTASADMGALFVDADGDGDADLVVASGGSRPARDSADFRATYQARLYVNDGRGRFRRDTAALPGVATSASCVVAADYDRDGRLDLFVCGRLTPGRYPLPPRSYLLHNETRPGGPPRFADVTTVAAPPLVRPGLVTGALWTDADRDGQVDLLLVGEWMPITYVKNRGGRFSDVTRTAGLAGTDGWWNGLAAGDFDGDGDPDYIAGNLGHNTRYRASPAEPLHVYAADFDGSGSVDPVLASYVDGVRVPVASRDLLLEQMPGMRRRFPGYREYARATLDETLTAEERRRAYVRQATTLATSYIENVGGGRFAVRPLPVEAQLAPTFGTVVGDYDGDGRLDALLVGNSYAPETQGGRHDAGTGVVLLGDGRGGFGVRRGGPSGFFVDGDARAAVAVGAGERRRLVLVAQHGDRVRAFAPRAAGAGRWVALAPHDAAADVTLADGSTQREELYYGGGYLSQAPRRLWVPDDVARVRVSDFAGRAREVAVRPAPKYASSRPPAPHGGPPPGRLAQR